MPLEQGDHSERQEARHERRALLEHVAAVPDRTDDRRVGRRAADLPVLKLLDQARLGVPSGRPRGVLGRVDAQRRERLALGQHRQAALLVVGVRGVVGGLHVGAQEPVEVDDLAGGGELGPVYRRRVEGLSVQRSAGTFRIMISGPGTRDPLDADRYRFPGRVLHLRRDRALPDQVVQPQLVALEAGPLGFGRGAEPVAGRADRLVRLLRVLHLARVGARRVRHVLRAVELTRLLPGGSDRGLRQRDRVGPHIGDVAVLVQPLGHGHRVLSGEPQLAGGLLLQRRGAERRVRRTAVRPALDRVDPEAGGVVAQPGGERGGARAVQVQDVGAAQFTLRREVAALGDPRAVHGQQRGGEARRAVGKPFPAVLLGGELRLEVPVARGPEGDPLPLLVDDQPGRDRLDAAGRQPWHDLLPQHRRHFVPVEPVQDAPGLIGVYLAVVELGRVGDRSRDRLRRDLVEDHPHGRNLRLQLFEKVPRDGFPSRSLLVAR